MPTTIDNSLLCENPQKAWVNRRMVKLGEKYDLRWWLRTRNKPSDYLAQQHSSGKTILPKRTRD